MKKLLPLLSLCFTLTAQSQQFDLACIGEGPNTTDQNIKIIYEPDKKEVFKDGESLNNIYPNIRATSSLLSLTVDDSIIKFSYAFDMVDEHSDTGNFVSIHSYQINRATGLMEISAKIVGDEDRILQKTPNPKLKCSKRKNKF